MNKLAILLKKIRVIHGERLFDMAQKLEVSSAFLSAVENGKKSAPASWVGILSREYSLSAEEKHAVEEAIGDSIKQVRLDLENASAAKRNCALMFARNFDDIEEERIQEIIKLLNKGGHQ